MKPIIHVPLYAVFTVAVLAGCQRAPGGEQDVDVATQAAAEIADPAPPVTGREAPQFQFSDDDIGIALAPTPGFTLDRDFHDMPPDGAWNSLAGPGVRGEPLLALVLDGSGPVVAAELHIGTSTDSHAVVTCLQPPQAATAGPSDEVRIDGQPFRHFRVVDAAMGQHHSVDAYRSLRNERCIAIDLQLWSRRPEVYDPPATPPFDEATARARLQEALGAVRIIR